jgi:hypothetical protein
VAGTLAFGDHHRYTRADLERIAAAMRAAGAALAVTTEKDLVRMLPLRPLPAPVWWVPLRVSVEPAAEFAAWLNRRIGLVVSGQLPVGSGQSATRDQLRTQDSELRTQNSELRTQN